jgi:hypothetical protein
MKLPTSVCEKCPPLYLYLRRDSSSLRNMRRKNPIISKHPVGRRRGVKIVGLLRQICPLGVRLEAWNLYVVCQKRAFLYALASGDGEYMAATCRVKRDCCQHYSKCAKSSDAPPASGPGGLSETAFWILRAPSQTLPREAPTYDAMRSGRWNGTPCFGSSDGTGRANRVQRKHGSRDWRRAVGRQVQRASGPSDVTNPLGAPMAGEINGRNDYVHIRRQFAGQGLQP